MKEGTAGGKYRSDHSDHLLEQKDNCSQGFELSAPLHLTWSCYVESETACGTCDSCVLRLRGFEKAGVVDPLPYRH